MNTYWEYLKQNKIIAGIIGLTLVGIALYANTLGNQMFWDDFDFILNNQYVHDWQYIPKYFSENIIAGASLVSNYWRPVLLLVFSIEYHLWGANPVGYHIVSMLFHIADAILVFLLLNNLFKSYKLGLCTALFFLIHPLQTESVAYVNSLGDSLSVFFMLIGLNNYLHFRQSGEQSGWWWSLACFPLALMSKETAIVYPALIGLVEIFNTPVRNPEFNSGSHERDPESSSGLRQKLLNILKFTWPAWGTAGFYIFLRATVLNFQNTFNLYNEQNVFTESIFVRLFTFFKILATYIGLLFYPHDLHMERSIDVAQSFLAPGVWLGALILILILFLIIYFWKRNSAVSFGFLWFLIGLAPTSNIVVPINGLLYEHWLYLPMIGFWLAVVVILSGSEGSHVRFFGQWPQNDKILKVIVTIFFISYFMFLSYTTIARNREWRDPITFYNQTLKYSPNSYRVANNLGMAYADSGQTENAKQMYKRAIMLDPEVQVAYHNLANAYQNLGQTDLAVENYLKAIELDPEFFYSYNALTKLYLDQKDYTRSREIQERFLPYSPNPEETKLLIEQIKKLEK